MSTPTTFQRQPRFARGERVLVTQASSSPPHFLPATIVELPGRAPMLRWLKVAFDDGSLAEVSVTSCHRDSPEFRAWAEMLARKEELGRTILAICQHEGYTFGGPACARLAEWAEYQQLSRTGLSETGAAAFGVHPYGV